MTRTEFKDCILEATKMFNLKEISPYVADVFFDEFSNIEKPLFMKALSNTAAAGMRFTLDNVFAGLTKATKDGHQKQRIVTDCLKCSGDGSIVVNNFAYACDSCKASENYPNYPKYTNQKNESLKVTDCGDHYLREFNAYKIKIPKNMQSIKDLVFEHAYSLVPKTTTTNNKNELKKPNFGVDL
jgi:hypothetical protein